MKGLEITESSDVRLTGNEKQQLEDGLRILARIIARAVLRERSLLERSQRGGRFDSAERTNLASIVRQPHEPLTVTVKEAAKILGLSRNSVYAAVHTGQIPSIRVGKRVFVPRVALERMLSQADSRSSDHCRH